MGENLTERHGDEIRQLARKHGVVRLRVFDSSATGAANKSFELSYLGCLNFCERSLIFSPPFLPYGERGNVED
jgi:hypothetical protein